MLNGREGQDDYDEGSFLVWTILPSLMSVRLCVFPDLGGSVVDPLAFLTSRRHGVKVRSLPFKVETRDHREDSPLSTTSFKE